MKQNHRHSTCITLLLSKCPVSDKTLKKRIHQSVLVFLRKDHQASILWLATDLLYIKLFAPARWFWEFRLRNHWTAAMCTFSVPQSPLTIKGQPPNWGAQSIKYCTVIIVSLLEGPTSSHHMCWLYQLMAPWIQKPNSFNLSYPSGCHVKLGPAATYFLLFNCFLDRSSTPSGSSPFTKCWSVSLSIRNLWSLRRRWCICQYQIQLPLDCNSWSIASTTLSTRDWIFFLQSPWDTRIFLRWRKLKWTPWYKAKKDRISV